MSRAYAVMYHRASFGEMLVWLNRQLHSDAPEPIKNLYIHLSEKGYIVRSAVPNLVRQDPDLVKAHLSVTNTSKQEAESHNWFKGKFCRQGVELPDL